MGRIISSFWISLDGVVEEPENWHMPYLDDELVDIISAGMKTNKALLMGRQLYDEWSAHWTTSTDDIAEYFNMVPKYVISSSLQDPTWNNTTAVPGDVEAVQKVKDGIDGDIQVTGCATTVRWLLAHDLLDELQLLVHPVVVGGKQQHLFEGDSPSHTLTLNDSRALSSGVVHHIYRPHPVHSGA